jgi:phage terminase small subunit
LVVKVGVDADGKGGTTQQNPYLPLVNRQSEIARKLASGLGLPVTARARLEAPQAPPPNGDDDDLAAAEMSDFDAYLAQHPDRTLN